MSESIRASRRMLFFVWGKKNRQVIEYDKEKWHIGKTKGNNMTRQKVEDWLEGDNRTLLEGWARNGLTDLQLCENMGIGKTTLYKWKKESTEFANILKRNKEVVDTEVENALYKAAISGNTTAMIFWLKNRKYKDWRDKYEEKDEEKEEEESGVIIIPSVEERNEE